MHPTGIRLTAAAALSLLVAGAAMAQETPPRTPPETSPSTDVPLTDAPATDAPTTNAPAADEPSNRPSEADDAPLTDTLVDDKAQAAADAEAASPDGAAPAEGEAAAPADSEAAPGAPAPGEITEVVRDTFEDWEVRCLSTGDECFMYQLALDETGNPVAEMSILKLPEGSEAQAGATLVTPLGTLLTSGVTVQVDDGERRQYPFNWCSQVGCFARYGLDAASLDSLRRGRETHLTVASVGAPETPVTVTLSLMGFTAAWDSLSAPE